MATCRLSPIPVSTQHFVVTLVTRPTALVKEGHITDKVVASLLPAALRRCPEVHNMTGPLMVLRVWSFLRLVGGVKFAIREHIPDLEFVDLRERSTDEIRRGCCRVTNSNPTP